MTIRTSLVRRIGYAAASTLAGAIVFYVVGDPTKFPLGMLGFGAFLVRVFVLCVVLYGQID